ncbi:hypothetical protein AAC387_Pa01g0973 [Persea americana]
MEEEDEMSDVYGHQRPEHSAENKLMEEAEHCSLPPFQEFDEFADPELLRCLHTAGEMMAASETMAAMAAKRMDMAEVKAEAEAEAEAMVKEMEISDVMKDTVPLNEVGGVEETAKTEVVNEALEREKMEVVDELPEKEVVKEAAEVEKETVEMEASEREVVKEVSETGVVEETGADVKVSEVEVTKENAEMEAEEVVAEELVEVAKETVETETEELAKDSMEMETEELAKETTEMETEELAKERASMVVETVVVKEGLEAETEMVAETVAVKEGLEAGTEMVGDTVVVKEGLEAETKMVADTVVVKEGLEGETQMVAETVVVKEGLERGTELVVETDTVKEGLRVEAVKEASESEVATEASRPKRGGGKRKRGRTVMRVQSRAPSKKKEEEDVCFICFDGGNLVLCDRRGCPKAYHPSCVNRDEAFFKARGRWNCGWHICSQCQKSAHYMCYTCTYSLCKGCIKESGFVCVRGNKGFCVTCMRTVMLIEQSFPANKEVAVIDFDDKSNWEYLFKDYWLDLKGKLSITTEELTSAKNPSKGSGVSVLNEESSGDLYDANDDNGSSSDSSLGHSEGRNSATRKKSKKQSRSLTNEVSTPSVKKAVRNEGVSVSGDTEWASNELLDLVAHMKDGDKSVLSQYDVQALLLEYIKQNNLRDPRKKSQIICDSRLQNLFGKARVGHFEMLKLLECHFLIKDVPDDTQGGVSDGEAFYVEAESHSDAISKAGSDKRRRTRKKAEERELQTNLDDYAAIDVHNINLVYLKRNLMEDLIDDIDNFQDRVVGSFVRIRISGAGQKQDMYRLVQVVGTGRAAEAYKTGKKTTDVTLEILNLNKTEVITIDIISNQEFSEEECKRLRQSIKCGFISRLTVGEIQEKAKGLQAVRVKDALEAEVLRLSHLRDRASEHGQKLELLNTPEERARRFQEIPEIHADPNMDPSYISDDEEEDLDDKKQQDGYARSRDSGFTRRGRDQIYPGKGSLVSNDGWNGGRKGSSTRWESSRNMVTKGVGWDKGDVATAAGEKSTESSQNQGRDAHQPSSWETPKSEVTVTSLETGDWSSQPTTPSGPSPSVLPGLASVPSTGVAVSSVGETDKIWHYKDPSGKIHGPFNMTQLRKWSKTGYFPADHRIWKASEKQEVSILLTDALIGKFEKEPPQREPHNSLSQHGTSNLQIEKQQNDGTWKSNLKDASSPANGNPDGWGSQLSGLAAPTVDSVTHKDVYSPRVHDSLKDSNAWAGQAQNHGPTPMSFSGQSHRMPFHHAREGQVGGNAGGWDANQNRGSNMNISSGFQSSSPGQSGESWKAQDNSSSKEREMVSAVVPPTIMTKGWGVDQVSRNDSSNLPTPTPKPSGGGWTAGHGTENMWSATSTVPEQPSNVKLAAASNATPPGGSGLPSSEAKGGDKINLGSGDGQRLGPTAENAMPPDGQGLDPPSGAMLRLDDLPRHSPEILLQATDNVPVKGSASGVPVSESLPSGNFVGQSSTMIGNWSAPLMGMAGQPSGWDVGSTAVAGNIQNNSSSGNVWNAGSAIQPAIPVNAGWTTLPTEIPNTGWGMTPENSNQGWAPGQGNPNMGWGITQQVNSGWAPGAPGNTNMVWGVDAQGNANVGWCPTPQGNANAGLDPSAGNSNIWGSQPKHPGERFSGQGDRGFQASNSGHGGARPWNRHSGGGGPFRGPPRGQRGVCKFHESGHCKKGASCDYLHT